MIITRPNFKQAYLVFAANGTIRLNKKTIGIWKRTSPKWGIRNLPKMVFTANVHYNRNSMVQLSNESKLQLMMAVGRNIPNTMLTPIAQS